MKTNNIFKIFAFVLPFAMGVCACEDDIPEEITELNLSHCFTPYGLTAYVENDDEVVFGWTVGKDADSYNLVVTSDAQFTEEVLSVVVPVEDIPYRAKMDAGTYYFKIQALSEGREASNWAYHTGRIRIVTAIDLAPVETANCYIVNKAGLYKFKAVQGCTATEVSGIKSVEVLWETSTESAAAGLAKKSVITDVSYTGEYVVFSTAEPLKAGNALIAARSEAGTILWSWHIWVTPDTVQDVDWGGGMVLMDRNLGETGNEGAPRTSMLYQWGRKDPFPGTCGNGELVAVAGTTTTYTSRQVNRATINANPTILYGAISTATAGAQPNYQNDNTYLWGEYGSTVKTVSDPCPPGYKVPQAFASQPSSPQNDLSLTRFSQMSSLAWQGATSGSHYEGTYDMTLSNGSVVRFGRSGMVLINTSTDNYTAASGNVQSDGNACYLWTASCTGTTLRRIAMCIRVSDTDGATFWAKSGDAAARYHGKNNAYPVRCEKIQ